MTVPLHIAVRVRQIITEACDHDPAYTALVERELAGLKPSVPAGSLERVWAHIQDPPSSLPTGAVASCGGSGNGGKS